MKKLLFLTLFFSLLMNNIYSQKNNVIKYDSLWYSHPFFIDLQAGVWTPIGKLSEYYNPSVQLGAGFGLGFRKLQVQLMVMARFPSERILLPIKVNDSIVFGKTIIGGNVGGWINYSFFRNKFLCSETVIGFTHEFISTDVINPKNNDTLSVGGLGISLGFNSWFKTFSKLNFGLRTIYTYSRYDNSKNLANAIGGHSFTFSLVYRFPRRDPSYEKYF